MNLSLMSNPEVTVVRKSFLRWYQGRNLESNQLEGKPGQCHYTIIFLLELCSIVSKTQLFVYLENVYLNKFENKVSGLTTIFTFLDIMAVY